MQQLRHARRTVAIICAAIVMFIVSTTLVTADITNEAPTLISYTHAQDYPDYPCPPPIYTWAYQVTGSLHSLQLISLEDGNARAIITQCPAGVEFFATSNNMSNWVLMGPVEAFGGENGYPCMYANYFRPEPIPLADAGIIRIERLPYQLNGQITWVAFAVMQDAAGNTWREQLRLFLDGTWINHIPYGTPTALTGLERVDWAREAIEFVVARNLMDLNYCPRTREPIAFNPSGFATRGDVLAAAVKALGLTPPEGTAPVPFNDVPDYGYGVYVNIAKQLGLVTGIGNNLFAPERTITRQDMMTMLYNILLAQGQIQPDTDLTALGRFNDLNQVSSHARLPISSLARAGIITGSGVNINPREYTTRVEAAMFVRNLYRVVTQNGGA